jgi:hypothetical protein
MCVASIGHNCTKKDIFISGDNGIVYIFYRTLLLRTSLQAENVILSFTARELAILKLLVVMGQ